VWQKVRRYESEPTPSSAWNRQRKFAAVPGPARAPHASAATSATRSHSLLDGTFTFDLTGPDCTELTADQLSQTTATNLHGRGFATITSTEEILGG
jgi:hypothetical protein